MVEEPRTPGSNNEISPVLRLIPYLLAFTVAIFVGLPVMGTGQLALGILAIGATYFGTFYLAKFIIERLAARLRRTDD